MAKITFEYKDFSAGDYGRQEAFKAPKNSWTGTNMLVYRTGEIGVRAGIRDVTPTGTVSAQAVFTMGRNPSNSGAVLYGHGAGHNQLIGFTPRGAGAAALTGTFSVTNPICYLWDDGGRLLIGTLSGGAYFTDGSSISAMTGSPNAQGICQYGDRTIIIPGGPTVRYSDAANVNSWPAGNTITVGGNDGIMTAIAQRGHLTLQKQGSAFYVLTGVPGVNDALRQAIRAAGPSNASNQFPASIAYDGDLAWYVPINGQSPCAFDGTTIRVFDNIVLDASGIGSPTTTSVLSLPYDDRKAVAVMQRQASVSPTTLWLYAHGAWTKHALGTTLSQHMAVISKTFYQAGTSATARTGGALMFVNTQNSPSFYSWMPFMDRPGLEADPDSISLDRAGDASSTPVTGNFTLPEEHSPNGDDLHVRSIIVDFRKWNTGGASNNHIDLTVNVLRSYETSGALSSSTQSWDEAPGSAALAGTTQRKVFGFGDQAAGGGFQLVFTNLRGIAIQRIIVIAEQTPPRV